MADRKEVPDSTPKERVRPVRQVREVDLLVVESINHWDATLEMNDPRDLGENNG